MSQNLVKSLQRSFATHFVKLEKMRTLVPRTIKAQWNGRPIKVREIVFDPLQIKKVKAKFTEAGFILDDRKHVLAVNADGSILVWGGANSVFRLRAGARITGALDERRLAFEDIGHFTDAFEVDATKKEVDAMIGKLKGSAWE
ncbi:MAG TPA: hypothetical protein VJA21_21285 [Verrucomicrobiae bacterium]